MKMSCLLFGLLYFQDKGKTEVLSQCLENSRNVRVAAEIKQEEGAVVKAAVKCEFWVCTDPKSKMPAEYFKVTGEKFFYEAYHLGARAFCRRSENGRWEKIKKPDDRGKDPNEKGQGDRGEDARSILKACLSPSLNKSIKSGADLKVNKQTYTLNKWHCSQVNFVSIFQNLAPNPS
jgi:hypothetical protein